MMHNPMRTRVPLAEAPGVFLDPLKWKEHERLRVGGYGPAPGVCTFGYPETETDRKRNRFEKLHREIESSIKAKLTTGELVAFAIDTKKPSDSPRASVAPELWHYLDLDFENSTASGNGYHLVAIEVSASSQKFVQEPICQAHSPSSGNTDDAVGVIKRRSTIAAFKECKRLIQEVASGSAYPGTKDALWALAQERIPSLSRCQFDQAWKEVAPSKWKVPGRRPIKGRVRSIGDGSPPAEGPSRSQLSVGKLPARSLKRTDRRRTKRPKKRDRRQ